VIQPIRDPACHTLEDYVKHSQLEDSGRHTHREIDTYLPSDQEKQTLRNVVKNAELELVADDNTGFDQDGNWRIRIDSSGDLVIEVRDSGSWTQQAKFEA
jgi:hypothetical protein